MRPASYGGEIPPPRVVPGPYGEHGINAVVITVELRDIAHIASALAGYAATLQTLAMQRSAASRVRIEQERRAERFRALAEDLDGMR